MFYFLIQIISLQKSIARWKERSTGTHSDTEYKQLLNTLEREKSKMTTALDQLKSMKSDKSCLEELVKCHNITINKPMIYIFNGIL